VILPWLLACRASDPEVEPPVTVAAMWAGDLETGAVTLGPVVVTSPRTAAGASFWVQDPGGGPATGLRVDVAGFQAGIPPEMGTEVTLTGPWSLDAEGVPSFAIDDDLDVAVGAAGQIVVPLGWTGDLAEVGSPVDLGEVSVASAVDPAGEADLDIGVHVSGAFGVFAGGWQERAEARGIALSTHEIAPRTAEDWVVVAEARPPEEVALDAVGEVPDGRPIRLVDVVQAAPWSDDGRWTSVQDGALGLWIDVEGRGERLTLEGDVATWEGEVRRGSDGVRLRVWLDPEVTGIADVATGAALVEGARVGLTLSGLGDPDVYGVRATAEGTALDDRFTSLDELPDPCLATGIVRVGADGALQLAPFAWE